MSFLIEMAPFEEQENMHLILIQQISSLIRNPEFREAVVDRED